MGVVSFEKLTADNIDVASYSGAAVTAAVCYISWWFWAYATASAMFFTPIFWNMLRLHALTVSIDLHRLSAISFIVQPWVESDRTSRSKPVNAISSRTYHLWSSREY